MTIFVLNNLSIYFLIYVYKKILSLFCQKNIAKYIYANYIAAMTLKQWIKKQGRGSLGKLAQATGIYYSNLHHMMTGRVSPGPMLALKISEACNHEVTIGELMKKKKSVKK